VLGQKEIQSKDIHRIKENLIILEDKIRNLKDDFTNKEKIKILNNTKDHVVRRKE